MENSIVDKEIVKKVLRIDEEQMKLFHELYSDLPRLGPGSIKSTTRAFQAIPDLPAQPQILDIGCGYGMQTRHLAKLSGGKISAVDNYLPYLEGLDKMAAAEGVADQIETFQASMTDMPFEAESFDLIWTEGAIFVIGFEKGLEDFRKLLKPGGYIAVSEVAWTKANPPKEVFEWWNTHYPAIKTVEETVAVFQSCGYELVDHFTEPASDWWNYINPLMEKVPAYREKYRDNPKAQGIADMTVDEKEICRKYSDYYSYEFIIGRKN